jgi:P4 family phage/plasmid primase-like protien
LFSRAAQAQAERDRTLRQDLDVSLIEASCGFMRAAATRAAERIKEPEWHAALSVWLRCEDGDTLAHARSSADPRYTYEETDRKLAQLRRATLEQGIGPVSCQRVRELSSNPENACAAACSSCRLGAPLGPIRSPASLGLRVETAATRADEAARRVEDLDDAIAQADTPDERKALRAERAEANRQRKEATSAATRAATLAAIATTGGRIFTRGDHAELSLALVGDLTTTAGGVSPVSALGRLYLHDTTTGTWVELPEHRLENHVATYAGTPIAGPRPAAQRINRGDQTGVSAMVASAIRAVSPDPLPTSVGVAFGDGMLLPDGSFRPYVPGDYVLAEHVLPVHYLDDNATPPRPARWLKFLEEVYAGEADIAERIAVVQEFLGACLLGVATSYQRSLVLLGETGANGKSVMLRVASSLFPTAAVGAIAPQHLAGGSSEYYRAMLLRIRLNVVSELPEQELMDTSVLKAAIAGDEFIAREIREAPFRGRPRAGWIIAANALPPVRDTSGGYWRRQLVLTHNVRFGAPGGPAADPHLADYLVAHELPGIAAWAAEGGRRLLVQGQYTALSSSDTVVANWARDNDPVLRFYEDHIVPDPTAPPVLASKIYAAYRQWSQENGNSPVASARLFRRFTTSFDLQATHTRAGNTYNVHIVGLAGFASRPTPTTRTTATTTPTAEA